LEWDGRGTYWAGRIGQTGLTMQFYGLLVNREPGKNVGKYPGQFTVDFLFPLRRGGGGLAL